VFERRASTHRYKNITAQETFPRVVGIITIISEDKHWPVVPRHNEGALLKLVSDSVNDMPYVNPMLGHWKLHELTRDPTMLSWWDRGAAQYVHDETHGSF
jgi:hypothetical protein